MVGSCVCEWCGDSFVKNRPNRRFCCQKCQVAANNKRWVSANKDRIKEYREETREKRNAMRREVYKQDRSRRVAARAAATEYRKKNPTRRKEHELKTKYGISLHEMNDLLLKQNNRCAICGFKNDGNKSFFPFVDHCHKTGVVRGLLCTKCNFGIGQFNDNPDLLRTAISYLEEAENA